VSSGVLQCPLVLPSQGPTLLLRVLQGLTWPIFCQVQINTCQASLTWPPVLQQQQQSNAASQHLSEHSRSSHLTHNISLCISTSRPIQELRNHWPYHDIRSSHHHNRLAKNPCRPAPGRAATPQSNVSPTGNAATCRVNLVSTAGSMS
jgi:hypothetical protein